MKKVFAISLFALLIITSCKKDSLKYTYGELAYDSSCSTWLIVVNNNCWLEPTNWNDFNVTLKTGQKVKLTYIDLKTQLCMGGQVKLTSITDN